MTEHRQKSNRNSFRLKEGWVRFVATCLLALAMALGVTGAIYGNLDYDSLVGFNQQAKRKARVVEAKYSNSLVEEKNENLIR